MAVEWLWVGAVTDGGCTVSMNLGASGNAGCRVSTDPAFGSTVWSTADGTTATTATYADATWDSADNLAKVAVTGLTPRTRYYVQGHDGTSYDTTHTAQFWTAPTLGAQEGYELIHWSCTSTVVAAQGSGDMTTARANMLQHWAEPGMAFHLGDWHYRDSTTSDVGERAGFIGEQLAVNGTGTTFMRLATEHPLVYMYDDHDFTGNDSYDGTAPAASAIQAECWSAVTPHYPLADDLGTPENTYGSAHHSFQIGNLYFIVTDLRANRDINTATDNTAKSMLGTTNTAAPSGDQLAWLLAEFDAAKAAGCSAIVWANTQVWNATGDGTNGADNEDQWWRFSTERQAIADHLNADPAIPKVLVISGDMHAWARERDYDASTAQDGVGATDVFNAASLNAAIGIWREANWDDGPELAAGCAGRLVVTENAAGRWVTWICIDDTVQKSSITYQIDAGVAVTEMGSGELGLGRTYADGTSAAELVALP